MRMLGCIKFLSSIWELHGLSGEGQVVQEIVQTQREHFGVRQMKWLRRGEVWAGIQKTQRVLRDS